MIETRLLKYFLVISQQSSFTKAAEILYVSQSTLSKQMMDLEKQVGKTLFIRGKRKVTLTEDGIFLRNRAEEILRLIENTEEAFNTDNVHLSGSITIGCGETVAMDVIASLFEEFHRKYPEVVLHTFSGDADAILEKFDRGLADMDLLLGPVKQEKYDYLNLHEKDVYGLLMPKDCELAKQSVINIDQLKSLPMILAHQTFSGHQDLDWFGKDVLHVVATYNLIYNATYFVEHHLGYALCLARLVNTRGRNLVFRPIVPELSLDIYMVTKKYQVLSPAAKAFLEYVKEYASKKRN